MSFHRRIHTIYRQELIAILRDRRTLIAMIVVPIVLYPFLMLGSIQAVTFQAHALDRESIVIGVVSDVHRQMLTDLILMDKAALERERVRLGPESPEAQALPPSLENARIRGADSVDELKQLIRRREVQIGVVFHADRLPDVDEYHRKVKATLFPDLEEVRSRSANDRLNALFVRTDERVENIRLRREDLPDAFVDPFEIVIEDLSAPPSILGQVLPLVLVLMTITGAIYPAIDLTAGERERGTLESLMVCPVPVLDLIVGKFLVVTTVAIMGAALNLGSVTATVYFGGFDKVIASSGGSVPLVKMGFILLCLIPFAVLMSAIMIAVCSYARTFKEAQNYVTPVILAVLIPGGLAALPATKLEGIMLVMPVGNMVLLARDLLLGAVVPLWQVAMVLLSTTLYAGAAVAVAASVFGHESVVFSDAVGLGRALRRSNIRPKAAPTVSTGLLVTALLFPIWFFVQSAFSPSAGQNAAGLLYATGWMMPLLFVVMPLLVLWYAKVDIVHAMSLRSPPARHLVAALLIGAGAWIPAHEVQVIQASWLGTPTIAVESAKAMAEAIALLPPGTVLVLIALIPAVCEELLFRGFLMGSLASSSRKWSAIVATGLVFGVFHFLVFKFLLTAGLGILLGYLCWQSRSILPAVVAHFLHNAIGVSSVLRPEWFTRLGIGEGGEWSHLPVPILIFGGAVFLIGVWMTRRPARSTMPMPSSAPLAADSLPG